MFLMAPRLTIAAALAIGCGSAAAINKCTDPDGSIVFQDAPCAGKGESIRVRPAAGTGVPGVQDASSKPVASEAQRLEANIAKSQKERRLRELQEREVPRAEAAVQNNLAACQRQQEEFEAMKYRYVQNLYGKTDAAQTAAEQAAAATRCELKDRELRATVERVKRECFDLGGCQ